MKRKNYAHAYLIRKELARGLTGGSCSVRGGGGAQNKKKKRHEHADEWLRVVSITEAFS